MKNIFKIILVTLFLFTISCKKNTSDNTSYREVTADINFDEILNCSEFIYMEGYFVTADYGCIYEPEGSNDLGNWMCKRKLHY